MSVNHIGKHHSLLTETPSSLESLAKAMNAVVDPFGITVSMLNAQMAWMLHPQELSRAMSAFSVNLLALQAHVWRRAFGIPSEDVVQPHGDDSRFAEAVWTDAATWDIVKEWYLACTHQFEDMFFETPGLSNKERSRAAFWMRKWLNMVAPTNFFWLNPVAQKRFAETGGESLKQGFRNFLRDLKARDILTVEPDAFTVGKDLATTPGKVVFRNRLVELIHYTPTTAQVKAIPIVIVTPWINKFYVLDLTAQKSLVKYLTDQGFSVFITSWKNPGADMADVRFDDYLLEGVHEVVQVAARFCKVPKVNLVGYCIGGTLVATYMAWANRRFGSAGHGDGVPVESWTLFATLTDFQHPGDIEVFIDQAAVEALEAWMAQKGYLDGSEMAASFRLLRSNPLIWRYWVHSYLLGESLPPFDVLFWNMDSTRMPRAMHSFYLREMYLNNQLIRRDKLSIAGEPIDLDRIVQPLYAVSAEDDHIAPWRQCYRIRRYINVNAPMRFVLSTSGHILGIVNPPVDPPKRSCWIADTGRNVAWERWLEQAEKRPGSWWEDWTAWLGEHSGGMVKAYPVASRAFPALADAPGTYVLEK